MSIFFDKFIENRGKRNDWQLIRLVCSSDSEARGGCFIISRTLSILVLYEVGIMKKNTNDDERNRLAIDTIGVFKRQRRRGGYFINKGC